MKKSFKNLLVAVALAGALLGPVCVRAEGLVDPTRPPMKSASKPATRAAEPRGSRVSAVIVSGDRRVAVFDGRVVKAGDKVGDIVIQEILTDGVRFARGAHSEIARLPKQAVVVRKPDSGPQKVARE